MLYVLGYVVSNAHYSRYAPVKATLLNGRYLAAGLLYLVFAVLPAVLGFMAFLDSRFRWSRADKSGAAAVAAAYLGVWALVTSQFGTLALINGADRKLFLFTGAAFLTAALYASLITAKPPSADRSARVSHYSSPIVGMVVGIAGLAYGFGSEIYPLVMPHFGGAAVREGYVVLRPGAPESLQLTLMNQRWPILDMDEEFLYLIACHPEFPTDKPQTLMVRLDLIASVGVASTARQFVAIPAYVAQHECGAERRTIWH